MVTKVLALGSFKTGCKGWDWWNVNSTCSYNNFSLHKPKYSEIYYLTAKQFPYAAVDYDLSSLDLWNGLQVQELFVFLLLWCPIKMRVFHQNECCLACPHPPSSYGGRREQEGSSHFDEKTLILIGHYGTISMMQPLNILQWCHFAARNQASEMRKNFGHT